MDTSREEIPLDPDKLDELHAELCKVFTHPTRVRILDLLRDGEENVGDLAEAMDLAQSNVSQHLNVMRNAGVLSYRREGNHVYYRLTDPRVLEAFDVIRDVLTDRVETGGRPLRGSGT